MKASAITPNYISRLVYARCVSLISNNSMVQYNIHISDIEDWLNLCYTYIYAIASSRC